MARTRTIGIRLCTTPRRVCATYFTSQCKGWRERNTVQLTGVLRISRGTASNRGGVLRTVTWFTVQPMLDRIRTTSSRTAVSLRIQFPIKMCVRFEDGIKHKTERDSVCWGSSTSSKSG